MPRIVGQSAEWQDVLRKATQVALTEATVLVTGESGAGKEVVARLVHRGSARRNRPFVALNCAALPEQLLESELFGYERGAFTSAQQAKPGQIEMASGGVLFLDEVSEMSLSAQAKFLRVLQEREFQRLGATRSIKAERARGRRDQPGTAKAVEQGSFREDLFYRLQVFDIHIAPLRERRADILPLAEAFLQEIAPSLGRPPAALAGDARQALLRHDWPGNVRELRNALERAAILSEGGPIEASHLALQTFVRAGPRRTTDLKVAERDAIAQVLRNAAGTSRRQRCVSACPERSCTPGCGDTGSSRRPSRSRAGWRDGAASTRWHMPATPNVDEAGCAAAPAGRSPRSGHHRRIWSPHAPGYDLVALELAEIEPESSAAEPLASEPGCGRRSPWPLCFWISVSPSQLGFALAPSPCALP